MTKAGDTMRGVWEVPDADTTGSVRNTETLDDKGYLRLSKSKSKNMFFDNIEAGSEVVEGGFIANDDRQQWVRSDDGDGFFTLMNSKTGLFLTGDKFIEKKGVKYNRLSIGNANEAKSLIGLISQLML